MEFHRNIMPQAETGTTVVTGPSLSEAFKQVKREFGPDAVISGSHSRSRRKSTGWGTEQVVDVMVETPGVERAPSHEANAQAPDTVDEIRGEVERLERLVQDICRSATDTQDDDASEPANPLAEHLIGNGASPAAVERLLTRFAGETGRSRNDRVGALTWLAANLATGPYDPAAWEGNHVFLGEYSSDRLDLVLPLASLLTEMGRRVLVVSVLPDPDRDEPRLKNLAASAGHDAAVVRDVRQLPDMEAHLEGYDVVLIDVPGLMDPQLHDDGAVHHWLVSNEKIHRHLLMPMDRDFQDLDDLKSAVRSLNCDWLALTRLDGTRRAGKILDLIDGLPLPVSFLMGIPTGPNRVGCATPELLLDRILENDESALEPTRKLER